MSSSSSKGQTGPKATSAPRRSNRGQGRQSPGPTSAPRTAPQAGPQPISNPAITTPLNQTPTGNFDYEYTFGQNAFATQFGGQGFSQQALNSQPAHQSLEPATSLNDFFCLDGATYFFDAEGNLHRVPVNFSFNNGQTQAQYPGAPQNMGSPTQFGGIQQPMVNPLENPRTGTMNMLSGLETQQNLFDPETLQANVMGTTTGDLPANFPNLPTMSHYQNPQYQALSSNTGFRDMPGSTMDHHDNDGFVIGMSTTSPTHHGLTSTMREEQVTSPTCDNAGVELVQSSMVPGNNVLEAQQGALDFLDGGTNLETDVYPEDPGQSEWVPDIFQTQRDAQTQVQNAVMEAPMDDNQFLGFFNNDDELQAHNQQPSLSPSQPCETDVERPQEISYAALSVNSIYHVPVEHDTRLLGDTTSAAKRRNNNDNVAVEDYDGATETSSSSEDEGKKQPKRGSRPDLKQIKLDRNWSEQKTQEVIRENDRRSRETRLIQKNRNNVASKKARREKIASIWLLLGHVDDLNEEVSELRKQVMENWEGIRDDDPPGMREKEKILAKREQRQKEEKRKQDEEDRRMGEKFGRMDLPKELFELVMKKKRGRNREDQEFAIEDDEKVEQYNLLTLGKWQKIRERKIKADRKMNKRRIRRAIRKEEERRRKSVVAEEAEAEAETEDDDDVVVYAADPAA